MDLSGLRRPIVGAPMAGGPSTPELAAAVSGAGGLGFLAAGYRTAEQVRHDVERVRALTDAPFGVNVFVPGPPSGDRAAVERYAASLAADARRLGVALGEPRWNDDGWEDKLALVASLRVPVVSFTFGCPPPSVLSGLRAAGGTVLVTVTTVEEARLAARAGADGLVVQGIEAGGHRGGFGDLDGVGETALLPLLRLVAAEVDLPLVGAGGIADGAGVAAALAAGAVAAQLGTAFLRCPEAGTSEPHRRALSGTAETVLTRAFSGRRARGIPNRFHADHGADAPAAYPDVHHLTGPLRAEARRSGQADAVNLWAGQGYPLCAEHPAGELVERLAADAARTAAEVAARLAR